VIFSKDHTALQIILYYDELEVCNPLGSRRKKHKLGAFYFNIGNISPKYRSTIGSIKLLALVKSSLISNFGIDQMIRPFINDIKSLESDNGVTFNINGQNRNFHGTVSVVSADNPASQAIGGFKEGAMAFRKCRFCLATDNDIQTKFNEASFELRNIEDHRRQCEMIETIPDLTSHYSLIFGINRRSPLTDLRGFDICSGLIPDIMHDILEGVLPLEMKLLLKHFVCEKKLLTLSTIDWNFQVLNLGFTDSDKPSLLSGILLNSSESTLRQHAMQMWTLGRFLPLAIGHLVDENDEYWLNFLRLLDIMDILFAKKVPRNLIGYLESLISDHHHGFKIIYPNNSITPKMHNMIHMPRLILK
jgi:hypothetical protein